MKKQEEERQEHARILDRMRHLCSAREYCTADIRQKISKMLTERTGRDGKAEEAEEIIGRNIANGEVELKQDNCKGKKKAKKHS